MELFVAISSETIELKFNSTPHIILRNCAIYHLLFYIILLSLIRNSQTAKYTQYPPKIEYNDVSGKSQTLDVISYLSTFLYSIAIQKESNLNYTHLQEFFNVINTNDELNYYFQYAQKLQDQHLNNIINIMASHKMCLNPNSTDIIKQFGYYIDLEKKKHTTSWPLTDINHWFWCPPYHDFDLFTVTNDDTRNGMNNVVGESILQRVGHNRIQHNMHTRLYNCNYELLFRAIYIPWKHVQDEDQISYTKNVQSFTLNPAGIIPVLSAHGERNKDYYDPKKYFILIMIAPIRLLGWNKMATVNFAYQIIDPRIPFIEEEIILPPFTRYNFVYLDDSASNYVFCNRNITPISSLIYSRVVRKWRNVMSEEALYYNIVQLSMHLVKTTKLKDHRIQFRFIDVENSNIATWKEWYKCVLP
eukprot:426288_1